MGYMVCGQGDEAVGGGGGFSWGGRAENLPSWVHSVCDGKQQPEAA